VSSVFDRPAHARTYAERRVMPQLVIARYLSLVKAAHHGARSPSVADVATGTGLFAKAFLADPEFGAEKVFAVDESESMLAELADTLPPEKPSRIELVHSDFLQWQPPEELGVVVCSEAIHLFSDLDRFVGHASSLLSPGGVLAIRTSSHQQLSERGWYQFFPRARLDLQRHWSMVYLRSTLEYFGFEVTVQEVDESHRMSWPELADFFRQKPYSTLHLLSDSEFAQGMAALDRPHHDAGFLFDYRMSLVLGRKPAAVQ
jgi:ubiquinone/menaquinone biosynthesis C-methylase UbiE